MQGGRLSDMDLRIVAGSFPRLEESFMPALHSSFSFPSFFAENGKLNPELFHSLTHERG
jgi:hypothetical protein